MALSEVLLNGQAVPWFEQTPSNPNAATVHFASANGFPIATYQEFFDAFADTYRFTGMDCRATWLPTQEPPKRFSAFDFADDLINIIEQQQRQAVIGMGHSYGGLITLIAATKRPDLFTKLVIIEPATTPQDWVLWFYSHIPRALLMRWFPLIEGSLKRRTTWSSPEEFYQHYHGHPTFKHFTDRSLTEYANNGLRQLDDGNYQLIFSPQWEAHIFCSLKSFWLYLNKLSIPVYVLRAQHSPLNTAQSYHRHRKVFKHHINTDVVADAHHLLTHEQPIKTANIIQSWLDNGH